jgi:hypothetical protein
VFPKGNAPFLFKEARYMYSPKIDEKLIPTLYHTARARRVPMTKLVAQLIRKALKAEILPADAIDALAVVNQSEYEVVMEVRTKVA